jgi:hypothetical protein
MRIGGSHMQPETVSEIDTPATDDWTEVLGQVPELIWAMVSRRSHGLAQFGGNQPVIFSSPGGGRK